MFAHWDIKQLRLGITQQPDAIVVSKVGHRMTAKPILFLFALREIWSIYIELKQQQQLWSPKA